MAFTQAAVNKAINSIRSIANWEITGTLGQGGFGRVLKARKRLVNGDLQLAAIKIINPARLQDDNNAIRRFAHEYEMMKRLDSPYVSRVLDSGQEPIQIGSEVVAIPWIATELIPGENLLEEISQHGILDKSQWLELAHDLLTAVAETHEKGVVHLDIKPNNVMRHARRSILVDFGVGSFVSVADPGDEGMHTLGFCAPEQIDGKTDAADLGYEADLFSVGTTLVYAGTGLAPWDLKEIGTPSNEKEARLFYQIRAKQLHQDMATKKPRIAGLDEEQVILVEQMLKNSPKMRTSAAELLAQVKALLPPGSLRKEENTNVRPVRSVPQILRDPRAEKLLNKNRLVTAPGPRNDEFEAPKVTAPKVRKDTAWNEIRTTIFLTLFTGPIGSGIRFYYLEQKKSKSSFAKLDRQLNAFLFAVLTAGFALPFIAGKWFQETKAKKYLVWTIITALPWPIVIGSATFGISSGEDTAAYSATSGVATFALFAMLVLIPVVTFKSPAIVEVPVSDNPSEDTK